MGGQNILISPPTMVVVRYANDYQLLADLFFFNKNALLVNSSLVCYLLSPDGGLWEPAPDQEFFAVLMVFLLRSAHARPGKGVFILLLIFGTFCTFLCHIYRGGAAQRTVLLEYCTHWGKGFSGSWFDYSLLSFKAIMSLLN